MQAPRTTGADDPERHLMTTPVTTIDQRFSAPDAVAVSWDETRTALEQAELFWITTVRADGRPHATPLVAVWADGALHFHTGPEEQKALNLRANPHVLLITGCNQWNTGLDVIVPTTVLELVTGTLIGPTPGFSAALPA